MKNTRFFYLALFLFIHAPIICMEDSELALVAEGLAALHNNGITLEGFRAPQPIAMERETSNQNDEKPAQPQHIIGLIEEHKVPQEPTTPETSPSVPQKVVSDLPEMSQPGDSSDEDNAPLSPSSLCKSIRSSISGNLQSDIAEFISIEKPKVALDQAQEFFYSNDKEQKAPKLTVRKIIEIFLADATKQREIVGSRSLAEIISPQAASLQIHYERLADTEELVNLYLSLKLKTSKMPFEQRKQSIEFEHCKLIYKSLKKKFKDDKKKVKELLYGAADYETDEEDMIDAGLQPDGLDVYRHSKNILTYVKPAIEKAIVGSDATINDLGNEQDDLIQQIKQLKQKKQETNLKLTQEIAHVRHARQALDIVENDRKEHKKYLDRRQKGLSDTIGSSKESITKISGEIENAAKKASKESDVESRKKLQAQKNEMEANRDQASAFLANLECKMKNFNSPTGYKLFGT